jgi:predicted metal-dependent hydrolase
METIQELKYLSGYSEDLTGKVRKLILQKKLGEFILNKYPETHKIRTDKALYDFAISLKNEYLQKSQPLSKVTYDSRINHIDHVLGMHYYIAKVQVSKIKAKNEIKIASIFKNVPEEFLRMIVVHELAHLKEKDHNRAFYKLCEYMEPEYYQIEFDMRLYLTYIEDAEPLYR